MARDLYARSERSGRNGEEAVLPEQQLGNGMARDGQALTQGPAQTGLRGIF